MFERENFFQIPQFLTFNEVLDLREQVQFLRTEFREATIGSSKRLETKIRSDQICWIDPETTATSLPLQNYFSKLESLRKSLNEKYFLGLNALDSHFALYQPGAFYERHLDVSSEKRSARKVSLVCYLNSSWKPADGGVLRLYFVNDSVDIEPQAGTLVGFLSDQVEHEVLPTYCERLSLTSWFLDSF